MERRARLVPLLRACLAAGALLASSSALFAACLLDLGSLSSAGASSSAGSGGSSSSGGAPTSSSSHSTATASTTSTTSTTSSTGVAGGGDGGPIPDAGGDANPGCAALDCSCEAPCPAGGCTPTVLATGATFADTPWGIVAPKAGGLYWTNQHGNNLARIKPGGGGPEVLTSATTPGAIAVVNGVVAWAAEDGVHSCTADTCGTTDAILHPSAAPGTVQGVAFDGQTVAWSDRVGVNAGQVLSCPIGACTSPTVLINGQIAPLGVALHGGSVFWIDQGNGNQNGNVAFGIKTGGSFTQVSAVLNLPTGLAVDATYVYWTEQLAAGRILRCPYAAGYCPSPIDAAAAAGPLGRPLDITLGGGRMYWSNADTGSILSCPTPGCGSAPPRVHATGRQGLRHVAVNATCLFWTDDTAGGSVLRVPR